MHSKIYISSRDLPNKNLDRMISRLRIRGVEVVLHPKKLGYAYSSPVMEPLEIFQAYTEELAKCESKQ